MAVHVCVRVSQEKAVKGSEAVSAETQVTCFYPQPGRTFVASFGNLIYFFVEQPLRGFILNWSPKVSSWNLKLKMAPFQRYLYTNTLGVGLAEEQYAEWQKTHLLGDRLVYTWSQECVCVCVFSCNRVEADIWSCRWWYILCWCHCFFVFVAVTCVGCCMQSAAAV